MARRVRVSGPVDQPEQEILGVQPGPDYDLQRAFNALTAKQIPYTELWEYYDGDQPLVYASSRLKEIFKNVDVRIVENWCAVVVDAVADRMQLQGLSAKDKVAADALGTIWQSQRLQLEAKSLHEAVLTIGEAFVIVWPGEVRESGGPQNGAQMYYNDPRLCHIFYDPANPRQKAYAAKWWVDAELKRRLTLYYPDRLRYFVSNGKASQVATWRSLHPAETPEETNPFGVVPVFHFRADQRVVKGELANVVTIQNAINKLLTDMMVSAEFGAFPQRYVISNADLATLKSAPYEHWYIPASDGLGQPTQVGQLPATELRNFTDAIEKLAADIGRITSTPKHFLFGQGGDPSGEALIAMEAPLNKKVHDRIDHLTPVWREAAAFALKIQGIEIEEADVIASWAPVETVQPKTQADIRESAVRAGIPLVTTLRREGWSDADLAQMAKDKQEASAQGAATLASALVQAQRNAGKSPVGGL